MKKIYKRDAKISVSKIVGLYIIFAWILVISLGYESITIKSLSYICVINNLSLIFCMYMIQKKLISFFSLFIYVSLIFHFGHLWLYSFSISLSNIKTWDIISLYPNDLVIETTSYSLIAINIITLIGMSFYTHINKKNNNSNLDCNNIDLLKRISRFGFILFFVIIIPTLILDVQKLIDVMNGGYTAVFQEKNKILTNIESFYPLSIICIMYGNRYNIKKIIPILIFTAIRLTILLVFIGNRSTIFVQAVIYFYIYHKYVSNISIKKLSRFIPVVILAITTILLIPYLAATRSRVGPSIGFIDYTINNNTIILIIAELGASLITPVLANLYTQEFGFAYGKTFISSLSILLPFSSSLFPDASLFVSVSSILNPYSPAKGALGGSFLGEMYFNFGWYSLILVGILALGLIAISNLLDDNKMKPSFVTCILLFNLYGIFMYVRGNFFDIVQHVNLSIYAFIIYLVYRILLNKRIRG